MLAITGYVAVISAVGAYTNSIIFGIHGSLLLLGWVLWRYAHAYWGGLIPTVLGSDMLLCASYAWVFHGAEDFMGFRVMLCGISSVLVFVGMGLFAWMASKKQPFWKHQFGVAISMLVALIAWWIAIPSLGNAAIGRRQAADIAANNLAIVQSIIVVENAVKQHGEAPDNETLHKLLSGPLPSIRWDGYSHEIQYQRTSSTTYQLTYIDPGHIFGDIIVYDSATPSKGWYRIKW